MPPLKAHKIDHRAEYPCPCRRRGRLQPIALTEALGCDLCQRIYVVSNSGCAIEELAATAPHKRAWRWTGTRWIFVQSPAIGENLLPQVALSVVGIVFLVVLLFKAEASTTGLILLGAVALALAISIGVVLLVWLAYRR